MSTTATTTLPAIGESAHVFVMHNVTRRCEIFEPHEKVYPNPTPLFYGLHKEVYSRL